MNTSPRASRKGDFFSKKEGEVPAPKDDHIAVLPLSSRYDLAFLVGSHSLDRLLSFWTRSKAAKEGKVFEEQEKNSRIHSSKLSSLLAFLLVALGALASVATDLAEAPSEEEEESEVTAVSCEADEDCAELEDSLYCLESYSLCVECRLDEHCKEQEECYEFSCRTNCEASSECEGETVCIDGLCRHCLEDADCGDTSLYCYLGTEFNACRPLCTSSQECEGPGYVDGDVCRGGRCQSVECSADQDCLLDREYCSPDTSTCVSLMK